jgi:K+-sensing histidine kinase KdpD
VGLSALALVLMVLMRPLLEPSVFFLFLAAVTISALYGGLGPGLAATALSGLASHYFFLKPPFALFSSPEGALRLSIFISTGVIVSWLAEGRKRAEERLQERNEYLELRPPTTTSPTCTTKRPSTSTSPAPSLGRGGGAARSP